MSYCGEILSSRARKISRFWACVQSTHVGQSADELPAQRKHLGGPALDCDYVFDYLQKFRVAREVLHPCELPGDFGRVPFDDPHEVVFAHALPDDMSGQFRKARVSLDVLRGE